MFIPLHVYTSYSFLQSGFTIDRLLSALKEKNYPSSAITDKDVLYGVPEFFLSAKKLGIRPIVGADFEVEGDLFTLIVQDELGYLNLCQLSTAVSKAPLTMATLKSHAEGLTVILNAKQSFLNKAFPTAPEGAIRKLKEISALSKSFYLAVEHYGPQDDAWAKFIRAIAEKYGYDLVAFPWIKYPKSSDAIVLDVLASIASNATLEAKEKEGPFYLYSPEELKAHYTDVELANTVKIGSASSFEFMTKRGTLLKYPVPKNSDATNALRMKAIEGLQTKTIDFTNIEYFHRLDTELKTIDQLGFSDYFLIVADFVTYAKNQRIMVGPGRGSAPGSLVAFALGITDIDPITHQLLFERFLNPSRKTLPDIDIDFADVDREKVVQYLVSKYQKERVAHIITFQTIQAKQAIRDIGRVYKISNQTIEMLAKTLTDSKLDLRGAYKKLPAFKNLFDSDPECAEVVRLAHRIEGFVRQSGLHPAGVVLNQTALDECLPLIDTGERLITQYEMDYLEPQGFLKIDLLGLRNLTTIQRTLELIEKRHKVQLQLPSIPYEDPRIFELLRTGMTLGIFQLESEGMKRTIKELSPKEFNDVVALLALYRPGPMENIKSYIARKEGRESVVSLDPQLNEVLNPTFGIIVYQEQIMKIAQIMGGFSLTKADDFRRSISKKDAKSLEALKEDFIQGAIAKGYKSSHALSVFNHILKFADYGFNKSHSVAYARLSCQMAYLKAVYPNEFYAAILDQTSFGTDGKMGEILDEFKVFKIKLVLPDINRSLDRFSSAEDGLIFPLSGIKGLPRDWVSSIIEERSENGPYDDFFDFVARLYDPKLTPAILEKLIDAGSFDRLHASRQTLRYAIPNALLYASVNASSDAEALIPGPEIPKIALKAVADDVASNIEKEKDVLGISLSGATFLKQKIVIPNRKLTAIASLVSSPSLVQIGGLIRQKKITRTKNNETMAFLTLLDDSGKLDVVVFAKLFAEIGSKIALNQTVVISGRLDESRGKNFIAEKIEIIAEAQ